MSVGGRRWLELSIRCPPAADGGALLVEGLLALGGRATEERDGRLLTHVEAPSDLDAFLARARATLVEMTGLDDLDLRTEWHAHEDWAETWKRGLTARTITPRVGVRPSWIPRRDDGGDVDIVIDPGMAFGTAEHGTTRGCLRMLDRVVREGDAVLDVGAGSGVLAIAAALLGASEVVAFEADTLACEALRENLALNGVDGRVRCVEGLADAETVAAYGPVAGVVANIQPLPLARLMPGLVGALGPRGWLIVSGIQEDAWAEMAAEVARHGPQLKAVDADGVWRTGLFGRDEGLGG